MMLDKRGITSFLLITFIITYVIEITLIMTGFRMTQVTAIYGQLVIAAIMWVPALAAVLTVKFVTREGFEITKLRFGPGSPIYLPPLLSR